MCIQSRAITFDVSAYVFCQNKKKQDQKTPKKWKKQRRRKRSLWFMTGYWEILTPWSPAWEWSAKWVVSRTRSLQWGTLKEKLLTKLSMLFKRPNKSCKMVRNKILYFDETIFEPSNLFCWSEREQPLESFSDHHTDPSPSGSQRVDQKDSYRPQGPPLIRLKSWQGHRQKFRLRLWLHLQERHF